MTNFNQLIEDINDEVRNSLEEHSITRFDVADILDKLANEYRRKDGKISVNDLAPGLLAEAPRHYYSNRVNFPNPETGYTNIVKASSGFGTIVKPRTISATSAATTIGSDGIVTFKLYDTDDLNPDLGTNTVADLPIYTRFYGDVEIIISEVNLISYPLVVSWIELIRKNLPNNRANTRHIRSSKSDVLFIPANTIRVHEQDLSIFNSEVGFTVDGAENIGIEIWFGVAVFDASTSAGIQAGLTFAREINSLNSGTNYPTITNPPWQSSTVQIMLENASYSVSQWTAGSKGDRGDVGPPGINSSYAGPWRQFQDYPAGSEVTYDGTKWYAPVNILGAATFQSQWVSLKGDAGSALEINPTGAATRTIEKLGVDNAIYKFAVDYADVANIPKFLLKFATTLSTNPPSHEGGEMVFYNSLTTDDTTDVGQNIPLGDMLTIQMSDHQGAYDSNQLDPNVAVNSVDMGPILDPIISNKRAVILKGYPNTMGGNPALGGNPIIYGGEISQVNIAAVGNTPAYNVYQFQGLTGRDFITTPDQGSVVINWELYEAPPLLAKVGISAKYADLLDPPNLENIRIQEFISDPLTTHLTGWNMLDANSGTFTGADGQVLATQGTGNNPPIEFAIAWNDENGNSHKDDLDLAANDEFIWKVGEAFIFGTVVSQRALQANSVDVAWEWTYTLDASRGEDAYNSLPAGAAEVYIRKALSRTYAKKNLDNLNLANLQAHGDPLADTTRIPIIDGNQIKWLTVAHFRRHLGTGVDFPGYEYTGANGNSFNSSTADNKIGWFGIGSSQFAITLSTTDNTDFTQRDDTGNLFEIYKDDDNFVFGVISTVSQGSGPNAGVTFVTLSTRYVHGTIAANDDVTLRIYTNDEDVVIPYIETSGTNVASGNTVVPMRYTKGTPLWVKFGSANDDDLSINVNQLGDEPVHWMNGDRIGASNPISANWMYPALYTGNRWVLGANYPKPSFTRTNLYDATYNFTNKQVKAITTSENWQEFEYLEILVEGSNDRHFFQTYSVPLLVSFSTNLTTGINWYDGANNSADKIVTVAVDDNVTKFIIGKRPSNTVLGIAVDKSGVNSRLAIWGIKH